jgi:regulator of replication initiation timing
MDMEELFGDNRLGMLEEKIDYLLKVYKGVKEEKNGLAGRIEALEAENRELKEQMARAESEKGMIMDKVIGILNKIERIEV